MEQVTRALSCLALSVSLALPAVATDYDLVILNGRVMDPETMFDAVMNVGVKDGTIAVTTRNQIRGDESIDATGLVVAPGFVDAHYHAMDPMGSRMGLRQGITTGLELEMGVTNAKQLRSVCETRGSPEYGEKAHETDTKNSKLQQRVSRGSCRWHAGVAGGPDRRDFSESVGPVRRSDHGPVTDRIEFAERVRSGEWNRLEQRAQLRVDQAAGP